MQTKWDYTNLADAYLKRPTYSKDVIDFILKLASVKSGSKVCDIGAGTAHLTLLLAEYNLDITAIEPNDAMRQNGKDRTHEFPNVKWVEATAENTFQADSTFDLVTFGSSFNVTHRESAVKEAYRILKPHSWFACMWNHRDLSDLLQSEIETIIKRNIVNYDYGSRREDQTQFLIDSRMFESIERIEREIIREQTKEECLEAWRSHNTLVRQAGSKLEKIISEIENALELCPGTTIKIPYITRAWAAKINKKG